MANGAIVVACANLGTDGEQRADAIGGYGTDWDAVVVADDDVVDELETVDFGVFGGAAVGAANAAIGAVGKY